jgi:hypothetical protein
MLKIYRQIEKFYSFLLFVLSHAKEALARGVHFFQQRSGCGGTAGYRLNRRISPKNAGGVPKSG